MATTELFSVGKRSGSPHPCNLPGITRCQRVMATYPLGPPSLSCSPQFLEKARPGMFGLVMISILVLITVVPPFAVMAVAKAKARRR